MRVLRTLRHLMLPRWLASRRFAPARSLTRIERAVAESETRHGGQLRVAMEHALDISALLRGQSARERALEVFSDLRVWDTRHNCGVLIYLLLADHDVEIVADRGIDEKVGQARWEVICREMEIEFRAGRFESGMLAGIERIGGLLAAHFPRSGKGDNFLPDRPIVI